MQKAVIHYGEIVVKNPDNYEARANLTWIGAYGLSNINRTLAKYEWSVFDMENEIAGIYDTPHGSLIYILIENWMKNNLNNKSKGRYYFY